MTASVALLAEQLSSTASWRDYVALTKPRIMSLLLLTAFCGMVAGAHGVPGARTTAALLIGGALASGGASALNHVLDRDIDRLMGKRTAARPVAAGRISARSAAIFGVALSIQSFVVLGVMTNLLAAALAIAGGAFYVVVYTRWLKRSTRHNIVIGGAAGAAPALVGWAAATGQVGVPALVLFAIVCIWTPPHFWALALLIKPGYEAAGVPMLPVVRGDQETSRQILRYSIVLVAVTVVPMAWHAFGVVYLGAALPLGAVFVYLARTLERDTTGRRASQLFHYSLLYLALLFAAVAVDAVV